MTDVDYKGKRVHAPREMWIDQQIFDIRLQIENEFCRQVNSGIRINPEEAKAILDFAKRAGVKNE